MSYHYVLQYTKLSGECEAVGADVELLFVQGQGQGSQRQLATLSEADRALLSEQLSGMQVRHAVVAGVIATRLDALRDAVRCHEKALERAKDSAKFVAAVHTQLKELSRPIGSRVEDVQGLMDNYQVSEVLWLARTHAVGWPTGLAWPGAMRWARVLLS